MYWVSNYQCELYEFFFNVEGRETAFGQFGQRSVSTGEEFINIQKL
jgi:hypothetical protein